MTFKSFRAGLFGALTAFCLAVAPVQAGERHLAERLPADTYAVFSIKDINEWKEKLAEAPMGRAWASEEATKLREKVATSVMTKIDEWLKENLRIEASELIEYFEGGVAVFGTNLRSYEKNDTIYQEFDICLVSELNEDHRKPLRKAVGDIFDEVSEDAEKDVEEYRGVKIYTIAITEQITEEMVPGLEPRDISVIHETKITFQYAFMDGYFLLCEGPNKPAKKIINALLSEDADRLSGREAFSKTSRRALGLGDVGGWVDLQHIIGYYLSLPENQGAGETLDALGISGLGAVAFGSELASNGVGSSVLALELPRERQGLVKLADAGQPNRLATAALVPADAISFVSWTLDLKAMYDELSRIAQEADSQGYAFFQMSIQQLNSELGIDLVNDIIANIAGEHAYFSRVDETREADPTPARFNEYNAPGPPTTGGTIISLRNGEQTVDVLDSLMNRLTKAPYQLPIEKELVRGFPVWSAKEEGQNGMGFGRMALTPERMIIGQTGSETLEILRQATGEGGASLRLNDEYGEVVSRFTTDNLRVFSFYPSDQYEQVAATLRMLLQQMMLVTGPSFDVARDISPEDVPSAEWWKKYFGPSGQAVYVDNEMLTVRMTSLPPVD